MGSNVNSLLGNLGGLDNQLNSLEGQMGGASNDPGQQMQLQAQMEQLMQKFSSISTILKDLNDMSMQIIQNSRTSG